MGDDSCRAFLMKKTGGGKKVPRKPKRPCSHPECPNLTDGRFCEEHEREENKRYEKYDRDPAARRRYGRAWKRIRDKYVSQHPFCEICYGFNIHGVVFDELHTQPNRKLFDVMTKGSGDSRMQPLYFLITTAGTDTNSICYETHQKAKDILEGRKIDSTFYPVIYGADEDDDWTDPEVWKKANPSLGVTVGIDKVEAACESAKQNPGEENTFRQLRLNQWVKQAVR